MMNLFGPFVQRQIAIEKRPLEQMTNAINVTKRQLIEVYKLFLAATIYKFIIVYFFNKMKNANTLERIRAKFSSVLSAGMTGPTEKNGHLHSQNDGKY